MLELLHFGFLLLQSKHCCAGGARAQGQRDADSRLAGATYFVLGLLEERGDDGVADVVLNEIVHVLQIVVNSFVS